jgi:DNA modification methylase
VGKLKLKSKHRLLCGDSTSQDDVARLMDGVKADLCFTSPPYNAGTTATEIKSNKKSKYANDLDNKTRSEYLSFLEEFTLLALSVCEFVFVNIQSIAGNKIALIEYLYLLQTKYADTIVWNKQHAQPAMASNVLNSQYEYVHCFSEKANRSIGVKEFRGTLSNVVDIGKQTENKIKNHNATFPTGLALYFVGNFSNDSIFDPFMGSGTTLIACEQLDRQCYGMEIEPLYCDVIVKRWENLTGEKAVCNG